MHIYRYICELLAIRFLCVACLCLKAGQKIQQLHSEAMGRMSNYLVNAM